VLFHSLNSCLLPSFLLLSFIICNFSLLTNTISCTCRTHEILNSRASLHTLNMLCFRYCKTAETAVCLELSLWNYVCPGSIDDDAFFFTSCRLRSLILRLPFHSAWPHPAHIHYTYCHNSSRIHFSSFSVLLAPAPNPVSIRRSVTGCSQFLWHKSNKYNAYKHEINPWTQSVLVLLGYYVPLPSLLFWHMIHVFLIQKARSSISDGT
jgi:hypothetical protein